nr:uncharacterized protein LOC113802304 isoform X2 [Penaeus vannamei]
MGRHGLVLLCVVKADLTPYIDQDARVWNATGAPVVVPLSGPEQHFLSIFSGHKVQPTIGLGGARATLSYRESGISVHVDGTAGHPLPAFTQHYLTIACYYGAHRVPMCDVNAGANDTPGKRLFMSEMPRSLVITGRVRDYFYVLLHAHNPNPNPTSDPKQSAQAPQNGGVGILLSVLLVVVTLVLAVAVAVALYLQCKEYLRREDEVMVAAKSGHYRQGVDKLLRFYELPATLRDTDGKTILHHAVSAKDDNGYPKWTLESLRSLLENHDCYRLLQAALCCEMADMPKDLKYG